METTTGGIDIIIPFPSILSQAEVSLEALMTDLQVLFVAGTHGNELNGSWLVDQWLMDPGLLQTNGLNVLPVIGNPQARQAQKRYLDVDLNRSFIPELLAKTSPKELEVRRAQELISQYGPNGASPCQIVIDLHSTTSAMGSSLVVYGRRPTDLALAALIQARLGLPVYLYEADQTQQGFLVEQWPCGLVVEIGPVPQMLIDARIVSQTRVAVQTCCEIISMVQQGTVSNPAQLVVHCHKCSLDLPRDVIGQPKAYVHPERQGMDWYPVHHGDPLFLMRDGAEVCFEGQETVVPVFINEAAYTEKNIAMSLTKKYVWPFALEWKDALQRLINP